MKAKLDSIFGKGKVVRITQTTHGHLADTPRNPNNHNILTFERAIDYNSEPYSTPTYAQGDGKLQKAVSTGDHKSYLQFLYDGVVMPKQQVHVFPTRDMMGRIGKRVKRGEKVGNVCPTEYKKDKKGNLLKDKNNKPILVHASHVHDDFYDATGKGKAPNPLEYLDRSVKIISVAPDILNDKVWFKANGKFNWSSFKDLYLKLPDPIVVPTPTPTIPVSESIPEPVQEPVPVVNTNNDINNPNRFAELIALLESVLERLKLLFKKD
jgi:hypothetical protein